MRRPGTNGDDNRVCCSRRPLDSGVTRDALFGFVGGVTPGRGQNAPRALLRAPESQSPHRAPLHKRRFAESTGVPAFRKRNDWPSGSLRFIEAQNVPLRGGCHDHSQGVQRQIQFNLAHHAFPVRGCRVFVRAHRNFPEILCNVPPFQGCNMDIVAFEDLQRNAIFSLDMLEMRLSAPG